CAAFRSAASSDPRIEWKFQRGSSLGLIYYSGELTEPYRGRVQFSRTSIRFQSVTREDSGRYICEVVGDGSHISKSEVNLIVQGQPIPVPVPIPVPCPHPWPSPLSLAQSLSLVLVPIPGLHLVPGHAWPWPCPCPQGGSRQCCHCPCPWGG
ncbi:JAM1 protein, partial [Oenanthe oenanthe]|nr:JAM1 protein [Oenanthe oenanthe]